MEVLLYFGAFHFKKKLNMKNENAHDLKCSGKQPLSELKISQSVKPSIKNDAMRPKEK